MKILQTINSLSAGGAEVFVANLAIAQQNAGHHVTVFTYAGILDEKGSQLHRLLVNSGVQYRSANIVDNRKKYKVPAILRQLIKDICPDAIHSHLEQSDIFLAIATIGLAKRPIIIRTIHNIFAPKSIPVPAHRWMSRRFTRTIACGKAVASQYPYLGLDACCIENGIDLSLVVPKRPREVIRNELRLAEDDLCLINVGSFHHRNGALQKAQDVIVDALALITSKRYRMLFLGDGAHRPAIEQRAHASGVADRCTFLGNVHNPADYLQAADLAIMPSRFEGMSIACIEAVCLSKPVVLSDIPSFEAFRGDATIFVEKESPGDLARAICQYFADPSSFNDLAEEHAGAYRKAFSIERVAERYLEVYRSGVKLNCSL